MRCAAHTGAPRSTDSSDLSLDASADSRVHCDLLNRVLLRSVPASSVSGVGAPDERGIDAAAVECTSVQCVGEEFNRWVVYDAKSGCTSTW